MEAKPDDVTGAVNIGNPVKFTIRGLAEKVIGITGSASKLDSRPLPRNDPTRRKPDILLAERNLTGQPDIQADRSLAATITYFEELMRTGKVT